MPLHLSVQSIIIIPFPEDVFHARLKTVGVCEYKFEMEAGFESGTEWRIIDVGGSRSQVSLPRLIIPPSVSPLSSDVSVHIRSPELPADPVVLPATWVPFFDDGEYYSADSYV